jgi:hypothetical protein
VEPNNNGLGSDAFALVWDGERLHGLNASGRSPAAWTPEYFAGRDRVPLLGWDSVTVPGAVSAWRALSGRFGALPFAELFTDAIRYAREGWYVGPKTAFYWQHAQRQFAAWPDWQAHFCPEGRAPAAGERFVPSAMADTLEAIAADQGESFYRGALAERMAACAAEAGGALTTDDLAAHEATWVEPISTAFAGAELHEIPPNGQGIGALIALGILERLRADLLDPDSADAVHLQIEACRVGIREAFTPGSRIPEVPRRRDRPRHCSHRPASMRLAARRSTPEPRRPHDPCAAAPRPTPSIWRRPPTPTAACRVAHPVQLPRLRLRRRRAGDRHRPAEPRRRLHPGARPPEPRGPEASAPSTPSFPASPAKRTAPPA